jgi:hypothetical protein
MKIPYSFSVLRYIHDIVTGEFINVGVVLYAPKARFLSAICTSRYGRLSKMFSNVSGDHFRQVSRYIQAKLEEEGERLLTQLPFDKLPISVLEFTTKVLPLDDSSLQFSPEGYGLTENPQETLEQLYNRYVEKYYEKPEKFSRSDDDVWRVFKKPLEEKRILGNLRPHQIVGNNYDYEFKYCWKNEKWHIHEPVSFDLIEPASITDKANNWLGRIISLHDGGEPFKMNILLGAPLDERLKSAFVKAQNIMHRMPCDHEFIKEDEAKDFAESLEKEIKAHKISE